ncbi:MAG: hypothetical protein A3F33_01375 [Candidatus Woykebacteria bacterium RIFCSPHIGHO2_12_FULL_43_10]|uniref:Uncharacterized protein n=2 Tax=Candidatus Woykeibacteriota TaxID=1817899 RepID=A0A1G1WTA2_9BACT|nr:MAG: hypothetical protein A2802_00235 [Candidatus Woykebacteria bacterium RIFCSPHIGHO2_01_FULL_43_29]OGY29717.1 MAG: hypothetical protein A3J50_00310 [Candidatus Woykebacteria bacterium RIFCSPHIGHO2_02_FULL_43_16b]OGY30409.1 MAG: hypothetical protein A3F33_01375 [Candidatus Woykebacteria bacterium RIFCSPHIGHO2_12_FULL_43_10]OGY30811.1 MAG: hypothetical protein A3A61_00085 [Candidatus Woykebacteria bacterium RIFCSPLOWO2_01_FULL_43_14]
MVSNSGRTPIEVLAERGRGAHAFYLGLVNDPETLDLRRKRLLGAITDFLRTGWLIDSEENFLWAVPEEEFASACKELGLDEMSIRKVRDFRGSGS